ncbi:unnamed protein product [Candida verbasci]|uniref:Protein phosphatase methylesterase 1 n=1 Tax=Candida verbasci TaxID=1227364 RepID=A0A9W4TUA5_9ASCO|nr:unnamed protein product [Candida verbasci]
MSDLHKSFLKRIKQQENRLGISINEEKNGDDDDNDIIENYKEFKSTFKAKIYEKDGCQFQTYYKPPKDNNHVLFCHHGAGSSSMTFGELTKFINDDSIGFFLFDMRGHGNSTIQENYSLDVLVDDVHYLLSNFIKEYNPDSIFFLGHSLGGAVFAKYTKIHKISLIKGLILLDIVEETAVSALSSMPQFIANRPTTFSSISKAIDWHMNFLLFNINSARISIPDLFHKNLTWKTDLSQTENYWNTWFTGLSDNFLNFQGSKLLILSAHETLDKRLMIGQMQGKYQLVIFGNNEKSGHFIHEDLAKQVSICISDFIKKSMYPEKFMRDDLGITPKWGGNINK